MKTYGFLKAAKLIFKILAWAALALGVIVGVIIIITGGGPALTGIPATAPGVPTAPITRAAGVVFIVIGGIYFLILFTISEIIGLLLDIKADCKKSAL